MHMSINNFINIPAFATWQHHSYRQDSKARRLLQKADMAAGAPLD